MMRWAAAVLACAALVSCSADPAPSASPSPSVTTVLPTSAPVVTTPAVTPTPTRATDLVDGRHYGILTAFDPAKRTVTIDVVQFLTGEAAEKAAKEDSEEYANDYYVRNTNTRLRVLTLTATAPIVVNTLTESETGSATEDKQVTPQKFASYFASGEAQQRMFYVTIAGGVVAKINEQFLP